MNRLIMFGELYNLTTHAWPPVYGVETWAFSRGTWTPFPSSIAHQPWLSSMAYDPAYHAIVGIGVVSRANHTAGTWLFRNGTWAMLTKTNQPGDAIAQSWHSTQSLVYDPSLGALVLSWSECDHSCVYVNYADGLEQMVEFKNGSWTKVSTSVTPGEREFFGMAYDAKDACILQFGGSSVLPNNVQSADDQTWIFR